MPIYKNHKYFFITTNSLYLYVFVIDSKNILYLIQRVMLDWTRLDWTSAHSQRL